MYSAQLPVVCSESHLGADGGGQLHGDVVADGGDLLEEDGRVEAEWAPDAVTQVTVPARGDAAQVASIALCSPAQKNAPAG